MSNKRGHSAVTTAASSNSSSSRTPAPITASTSSSASSSSSDQPQKRPKFDDLVSELAAEYGGTPVQKSSINGIAIGSAPPEQKSSRMEDDDEDRGDDTTTDLIPRNLTADEEMDAILQLVNDAPEVAELDIEGARGLISRFSKAVAKNLEQRARYTDEPMKFMESELALDEACQSLAGIGTSSALYPLLLEQHSGESAMDLLLTLLLNHENIDISIDALGILHEVIDAEELGSGEEDNERLDAFVEYVTVKSTFLATMVRALETRFTHENTREFSEAVKQILGIIENLTDLKPKEVSEKLVSDTNLIEWIMMRMKQESFNANKLYASEILSIVLTNAGVAGQTQLGTKVLNGAGIKNLIRFIAKYRKEDPSNEEETEYVENLFDVLCIVLHQNEGNQQKFAAHDGFQLMLTMIRRQTYASCIAFKAIDYGLTGSQSACEIFIDESGLKTLFAAYMHEPSTKKERADQTANEQHYLQILTQLFLHVNNVRYLRLRAKFEEQEMVKTERTVELLVKYLMRVEEAEAKYQSTSEGGAAAASSTAAAASSSTSSSSPSSTSAPPTEEELATYSRQTDHGLTHVELASVVLAFLATSENKDLRSRVDQLLNQQDLSFTTIQKTLRTYVRMMGDDDTTNEATKKQKAVLEALATMITEEEA